MLKRFVLFPTPNEGLQAVDVFDVETYMEGGPGRTKIVCSGSVFVVLLDIREAHNIIRHELMSHYSGNFPVMNVKGGESDG